MEDHPLNELIWIESLLPPEFESTPKMGGMAYYLDMKFVMLVVEKYDGVREHKGATYPFDLWNGVILPIEQKKQSAFFLKFLFLENHPANKDWLYIPYDSENFEDEVKQFVREIVRGNPLLGVPVKFSGMPKSEAASDASKKKKAKKVKVDKKTENAFLMSVAARKRQ